MWKKQFPKFCNMDFSYKKNFLMENSTALFLLTKYNNFMDENTRDTSLLSIP